MPNQNYSIHYPKGAPMNIMQHELENKIIDSYDGRFTDQKHQDWFEDSGFSNYGYWTRDTNNQLDASKLLVDKILEPVIDSMKKTTILDIACGGGGTSKQLTNYFDPANITGINISQHQINLAAKNVPEAKFEVMSAVDLDFPDQSFDNIISVEAAFHFYTREKFLKEAFRVLKPGGYLVLSDIIFNAGLLFQMLRKVKIVKESLYPPENIINFKTYKQGLVNAGFNTISIKNEIKKTWKPHYKIIMNYKLWNFLTKPTLTNLKEALKYKYFDVHQTHYLLVALQKPQG